jgi:multimeric flavodoxin WrbA
MKKNVLVISTSLRVNSNSEVLADAFMKGCIENGCSAEKISLRDKNIAFCRGCLACQKTKKCVIHDDAVEIAEKMCRADSIAFATPIYYYEMSGQMKTLLDRVNSLFASDYAFRNIYMLTSAADKDEHTPDRAVSGLEGWIDCFEKASLKGTVFAGGVGAEGEIEGSSAVEKAYQLGRTIKGEE